MAYLLAPAGTEPPPSSRELIRGVVAALLLCLATRAVVWTAAYTGGAMKVRIVAQASPPLSWHAKAITTQLADPQSRLSQAIGREASDFAPLCRWDGGHYEWIIRDGYKYQPPKPNTPNYENQWNIAFFPLYPLTARLFTGWLGVHGAMVFVPNVAALLAAPIFYLFCRRRMPQDAALTATACLFCWPTASFLSFAYSEGLTLLLVCLVCLLADRGRFAAATFCCALATAARPTAIWLAPVLGLLHLVRTPPNGMKRWIVSVVISGCAVAGAAFYAAFLWREFGSPAVYVDNQRVGWLGAAATPDWKALLLFARLGDGFKYIGRAITEFPFGLLHLTNPSTWSVPQTLALLFVSIAGFWRVPRDFRPFLWFGLLIFLQGYLAVGWLGHAMDSITRYVGIAAPIFAVLGAWIAREWSAGARATFFAALVGLQAIWAFNFGLHEWCG